MLQRKAYNELLAWKKDHTQECLMVKGARQVGKTFLIREFGKNEYASFIEINFLKYPQLKEIFSEDLAPEIIYKKMTANMQGIKFVPGDTLIFLDEIQCCGNARTAVKFLAEDGKYDVIESGSLLGLSYAEEGDETVEQPTSIPVGYENYLTMHSLDFEEYLWAMGYGPDAIQILKEHYDKNETISKITHDKYESLFREYMVIGGMPEVVADFAEYQDFNRADRIQKLIVEAYRLDIAKHAKGAEKIKVRDCYDSIPRQLARELKKFQYSAVEKGQTSKKYGNSIKWLEDSSLVNVCYNINEPYIPLEANAKKEQFKLYINDTGLLCSIYGFETKRGILNNTLKGNAKGGIYENAISECLIKKGYKLYYYKPDDNHELEFLLEKEGSVVPVEVKAGNTSSVSLNNFIKDFAPHNAYKICDAGIGIVDSKKTIPHYLAMFL